MAYDDIRDLEYCPIMDSGYKTQDTYKEDLYHATVNVKSVCENGLKSRYELIQSSEYQSGLGGNPSDRLISFTMNPEIAKSIANTLKTLVLMSTWDSDAQDFVISFDNLPEWLDYNEEFSNNMTTDNIADHIDRHRGRKDEFGIQRGLPLTYSDIWKLLDKNPELCRITESGWHNFMTKERWENLKVGNILKQNDWTEESRKRWQYLYPSDEGYQVIYPTKEMAKEGIKSKYAWIHTENRSEIQQELVQFWNNCYNGLREIAGGIPNPFVYTEEMRDLSRIDPDNIGVVKVTASLPYSIEDLKKIGIAHRYYSKYGIKADDSLTDEEKESMIESFDYLTKMKEDMDDIYDIAVKYNDKSLEEIMIGKNRVSNLTVVNIRDPNKKTVL